MNAITLMAAALAGWINREQQDMIEYLREEVNHPVLLDNRFKRW